MTRAGNIDMTSGRLMPNMIRYTIPIIFTGILQLLYNAADLVVIGQFGSENAFAAVGATPSLYSLFTNLFIGISSGGCIVVAQFYGARDKKSVQETVHTSILLSIIAGMIIAVFGFFFVDDILRLMGTHPDIIGESTLYMQILLLSMPFMLFYNFSAGILRATGDTKRPFYILMFTGLVNVVLNLIFVIIFKMSVAGVALATAIGSVLNAILGGLLLIKSDDSIHLDFKMLKIHGDKLAKVLRYGVPLGIQSLVFSMSNVIIQSAVNSLDDINIVAGNSASANIEGFIYVSMTAACTTALNFVAQNFGARQYKRISKVLINSFILVAVIALSMGILAVVFSDVLLAIYQPDNPAAVEFGKQRLYLIALTYFLAGFMDTLTYTLKGIGINYTSMIVTILGIVGVRIMWIFTVFQKYPTLRVLYTSWPLTWIFVNIILITIFLLRRKKIYEKNELLYADNV